MFCPKCGKQLDDEAVLCPMCGTRLDRPAPQPAAKKKKGTWKLVVGVILLLSAVQAFLQSFVMGVVYTLLGAALILWWAMGRRQ